MGWVSHFEDDHRRLDDDVQHFRATLDQPGKQSDPRPRAEAVLNVCEALLRKLKSYLDIATDPSVDLAKEIADLREKNRLQDAEISRLVRKNDSLAQQVSDLTSRARRAEEELKKFTEYSVRRLREDKNSAGFRNSEPTRRSRGRRRDRTQRGRTPSLPHP